ncbi:hypothetical protein GCM10009579_32690 [Streptomyces javensis]|uniref:Uncharacterized protein n=1 Tax=Streptomyces javensis TaxID=114698 RepID=A0ABN1WZP5_9ACTN
MLATPLVVVSVLGRGELRRCRPDCYLAPPEQRERPAGRFTAAEYGNRFDRDRLLAKGLVAHGAVRDHSSVAKVDH